MRIRRAYRPDPERELEALLLLLRSVPDSQAGPQDDLQANETTDANEFASSSSGGDGGVRIPAGRAAKERG